MGTVLKPSPVSGSKMAVVQASVAGLALLMNSVSVVDAARSTFIKQGGFNGKFNSESFDSVESDDPVWTMLQSHLDAAQQAGDNKLVTAMAQVRKLVKSRLG